MPAERTPRCSVVVAAHNAARTVTQTVASVRLQTFEDWEVLVVDDGSTDDTAAIVEAIPDPRVHLLRQVNQGPSAARNTGLHAARGQLVSTLDSDDLWLPTYLERMVGLLASRPDAAVAYTDAWAMDDATGRIRKTSAMAYQRAPARPPASSTEFLSALLASNFVYNSVTMRREVVAATGGYDTAIWGGEDWELWLRISSLGYRFVRADDRLAVYRQREGSLSTRSESMVAGNSRVYQLVEHEWDVPPEIKEQARWLGSAYRHGRTHGRARRDPLLPLRLLKRAVERRTIWYDRPPPELAGALAAIAAMAAQDVS